METLFETPRAGKVLCRLGNYRESSLGRLGVHTVTRSARPTILELAAVLESMPLGLCSSGWLFFPPPAHVNVTLKWE